MPTRKPLKNSYAAQHPDRYELAKERGYPAMAEVLRYHTTLIAAGKALGLQTGATYYSLFCDTSKSLPGSLTEYKAREWLEEHTQKPAQEEEPPVEPAPPAAEPTPPAGKMEKVKRVLPMLGCEVEDV